MLSVIFWTVNFNKNFKAFILLINKLNLYAIYEEFRRKVRKK